VARSPRFGRGTFNDTCNTWTSRTQDGYGSTLLGEDGAPHLQSTSSFPLPPGCSAAHPIACCR
jgi:hypothetical protein